MKLKKITLYVSGVFLLLAGFLLLAPRLFKKQISTAVNDAVKEYITTPVTFTDLDVSFFKNFPNLSVSLQKLSVEAPAESGSFKTVETESVDLGIDVLSLFGSQIKFTQLYVNEGTFKIVTDSLGNFSFDVFKSTEETAEKSSFDLSLKKIHVRNADVLYQDDQSKIKVHTKGTHITGTVRVTDHFIDFNTNTDIRSLFFGLDQSVYVDRKPLKGTINTRVNLDPVSVEFRQNKLVLAHLPLAITGTVGTDEKGTDFKLKVTSGEATLAALFSLVPEEYRSWYEGMEFKGNADVHLDLNGRMQEAVSKPDLRIEIKVRGGEVASKQFKDIPVKHITTDMVLQLPALNPDSLNLNISNFAFKLGEGFAKGYAGYKYPMYVDAGMEAQLDMTKLWKTLAIEGMQLKGDLKLKAAVKGAYARATTRKGNMYSITSVPEFNIDASWKNGYFQWKQMPMAVDQLSFDLKAVNNDGNYRHTKLEVRNLDARAGNNYINGRFSVENLVDYDLNTTLKAYVDLLDIRKIVPVKNVDFGGELTVDSSARGRLDLKRQRIPQTRTVVKLKNGFVRYANLPDLPLEKINLETHIESVRGSFSDLRMKILPISFVLAGEPFRLDASMFNFNNLTFDIGTKGTLNLHNVYKLFAVDGWDVNGRIEADLKVKGKGGAEDPSSLKNRGFVLLKDIHIRSDYFPHDFIFREGMFRFYRNKMKLENIKMNYAGQSFVLNGNLENYINYFLTPGATLKGNLDVASGFLDVNSFMTGNTVSASAANPAAKSNATGVVLVPDKIRFEVSADIQKVRFNDLVLSDLKGILKIYDKKMELEQTRFNLIDAPFLFSGSYKPLSPKRALFSFDIDAAHFDIQRAYNEMALFREMAPAAQSASGQVSLKYSLGGILNREMFPEMKSLKGAGALVLENIRFKGFKLFNAVARETKTDALHDADVKNVTVKTSIADNVMTIERTKFKIAGFRPRVEGQVTLDGKLNIGMRLGLPPFGIIGIPVTVKGTSDAFDISLGKYREEALKEDDEEYEAYRKTLEEEVEAEPKN